MEYSHSPRFRPLVSSPNDKMSATLEEESRDSLFSASICLAISARLRSGDEEERADGDCPWLRLANFLDEVNADLRDSSACGDRMIGWVTILTMVAESLDLQKIDPDFHFLLSLFVQACLLIELEQTQKLPPDDSSENRDASRARIQASLDFVVEELAERRRRERRVGSRLIAAA